MSFTLGAGAGPGSGVARFSSTPGRMQGTPTNGVNYPSPFFDVAHTYLPVTVKQLFRWCRYYFLTNPLINATIFKLSEYPITDLVVEHENADVKERWEAYFREHLRYRPFQIECGLDYHCLAGETLVTTDQGVYPIRELVGKTVNVLSEGGVYRSATFSSYGSQRLWEVHVDDGVLYATEEHEWVVYGCKKRIPTSKLKGRSIPRVSAHCRPPQNEEFWEGVRHGIVFGDGTLSNEGKQAHVLLHTPQKRTLAKYFEGFGTVTPHYEDKYLGVYGQPPHYKELPGSIASASYWYGFMAGLLATDGCVDVRGDTTLTQKDPTPLLEIQKRLPWLGLLGGKTREHTAYNMFTEQLEPMNYLGLKRQSLHPQDFVRPDQQELFTSNYEETLYGKYAKVKKVVPTTRVEEVFCCVEPETHSFVIEGGLLTGNCYGNAMVSLGFPFHKYLECQHCRFTERAEKIRQYWTFTNLTFRLSCPKCGTTSEAAVQDFYYKDANGIHPIRWNCEHVEVTYNDVTGESTYFYTIPPTVRNDVIIGKKDVVETIPQVFIQAMRERKGVVFSKDNFFHMKRPTLAQQDRGWGTPIVLPVLKDTFYLQIMKKAQEAILLEHIVPLRVLFPQAGSGSSDPYSTINLVDWRDHVAREIARWRHDNNYIPIMPLPIGNQTVGGDGRALMLTQEIQVWSEHIMSGLGVPREFLLGGMSYSGTNVSMRMLENQFLGFILRHKQMANWIMKQVSSYMGWPMAEIRFKPFKMADDIQRKAYLFQLNQAQKISDRTLLSDADLDQEKEDEIMVQETTRRLQATKKQQLALAEVQGEAQVVMAKAQVKAQQTMAQAQQAAVAPGEPGGGETGAPNPMQSMQSQLDMQQSQGMLPAEGGQAAMGADIEQVAMMFAQQIAELPPDQQQVAMENLMSQSPELAQLVHQLLQQMTGSAGGPQGAVMNSVTQVDTRPQPEQLPARRVAAAV